MAHTILRLPQVKSRVGLSRSSIYAAVSDGRFPQPIKTWNSLNRLGLQ